MDGEEVGDVAVAGLWFFVGIGPFHQAAVGTDLWRGQLGAGGADLGNHRIIKAEDFGGFERVGEDIPDDFLAHGGAHRELQHVLLAGNSETVFRGGVGTAHKLAGLRVGDKIVEVKQGGLAQQRPCAFPEKLPVAGEAIVFHEMLAAPAGAMRPHAVLDNAENGGEKRGVGGVADGEGAGAEGIPGGLFTGWDECFDEIEKRFVTFG